MIINLDPGDWATWIGSIGTLAAFIVAFLQIRTERRHRHRQELRDWLAQHRGHADRVTAWVSGPKLVIANESGHLIHDVEVNCGSEQGPGAKPDHTFPHLEPGRTVIELDQEPRANPDADTIPADGPVASLTFTDARANRWVRRGASAPELVSGPDAAAARERRARLGASDFETES